MKNKTIDTINIERKKNNIVVFDINQRISNLDKQVYHYYLLHKLNQKCCFDYLWMWFNEHFGAILQAYIHNKNEKFMLVILYLKRSKKFIKL